MDIATVKTQHASTTIDVWISGGCLWIELDDSDGSSKLAKLDKSDVLMLLDALAVHQELG